jgi:hypothetical protein
MQRFYFLNAIPESDLQPHTILKGETPTGTCSFGANFPFNPLQAFPTRSEGK